MAEPARHRPPARAPVRSGARLRHAVVALACAASLMGGSASPAAAAEPLPAQGVYEACDGAHEQDCLARLAEIRQAGFTVVLNYRQWFNTPDQVVRYANRAHELGLQIVWPLDSPHWRRGGDLFTPYPELATGCGCNSNEHLKRYIFDLVKDHPATWGYYVGDEIPVEERDLARGFAAEVQARDPHHPRLIVSLEWPGSRAANLAPFVDTADVLGSDFYPVGTDFAASQTSLVARDVGELAARSAKPSAFVLQAHNLGLYPQHADLPGARWPTREEMQEMRDLALIHARPSLLLWYSYFDIKRFPDSEQHWANLVSAAFAPFDPRADEGAGPSAGEVPATEPPSALALERVPRRLTRRRLLRRGVTGVAVPASPSSLEIALVGRLQARGRIARAGDVILAERSFSRVEQRRRFRLRVRRRLRSLLGRRSRLTLRVRFTDSTRRRATRRRVIHVR